MNYKNIKYEVGYYNARDYGDFIKVQQKNGKKYQLLDKTSCEPIEFGGKNEFYAHFNFYPSMSNKYILIQFEEDGKVQLFHKSGGKPIKLCGRTKFYYAYFTDIGDSSILHIHPTELWSSPYNYKLFLVSDKYITKISKKQEQFLEEEFKEKQRDELQDFLSSKWWREIVSFMEWIKNYNIGNMQNNMTEEQKSTKKYTEYDKLMIKNEMIDGLMEFVDRMGQHIK